MATLTPQALTGLEYLKTINPALAASIQKSFSPSASTPIDASIIGSSPTVSVPPAPTVQIPDYTKLTISTPPIVNTDLQNELDAEKTAIVGDINALDAKAATKSATKAALETSQNIPGLSLQLNEVMTQMRNLDAEAFNASNKSENRLAPMFAIRGEQVAIERQRAVQKYGLAAQAEAIQGNIALANDNVTRALDAEFGGIEKEIEHKMFLLDQNRENWNTEEKRAAEKRQIELENERERVAQARADKENILKIMLEAAQNGADNMTLNSIKDSKDPEEAAARAGSALGAGFRAQQEQQKFENNLALRNMALNEAQLRLAQNKFQFEKDQINADIESGILTEAQIKNIDNSPQGKKIKSLGDLRMKTTAYQELVKQYGTASFGKQKATLDAAFADLKIAYKTAAELGALQGPDILLLEEALRPASFSNPLSQAFAVLTGSGKGTIGANLDQAVKTIDASAESNITQLLARNPKYKDSNYVQALSLPFMKPDTGTVQIGGQNVQVGTIIENEQGQRARVNADGTVTPL